MTLTAHVSSTTNAIHTRWRRRSSYSVHPEWCPLQLLMSAQCDDVRPKTDGVRVGGPNVTAAWSLQLTKLYAALNSVLGTADRYRTLLTSKIKRTVSWLSRIQWSRIALLPCLLTRPTLHRLRVTNLVALSLWRKVEKRWRNELRIEMVLRPNLTTAIQSLKSLSNNGINVVYNSTVNIRRRQVEICGINKWHLSE